MGNAEPQPHYYTPTEYFALEEKSEVRHEYFDGEIFAMAGASKTHNDIALNCALALRTTLRGSSCRAYASDVRVVVQENRHYTYPDVVVSCDPTDQRDEYQIRQPLLIVEVLSDSTAKYDRAEKFLQYQKLPSLRHYILIHQDQWLVEWFRLNEAGEWIIHLLNAPDSMLEIPGLNLQLPLTDLYMDTDIAPLYIAPNSSQQPF
jgi:Uma2 family endonuclease